MIFSVIVATYRRPEKLQWCLEALAGQDFPKEDYEIIVVEDEKGGAGQAVVEVAKAQFKGVRYLNQDHCGPGAARNSGIAGAKGEVIVFTDDDCVVPEDWLKRIADGFKRFPKAAGVGGYMEAPAAVLKRNIFAQYESYVTRRVYGAGKKEILGGFEVPTGGTNNIAYRKKVLEEIGGFDESFPVAAGEDADLKKRICDRGHQILYLPLKVEHRHDYSWRSFLKQSRDRGVGSTYFHRKHGGGLSKIQMVGILLKSPLMLVNDLLPRKMSVAAAVLKFVVLWVDGITQIKLKGQSSKLKTAA
ncbi:glycosyltransferase [Candidatus Parcubacteria bacterium]|nr:glycosyltransferase [Candidatus Parcubacteria bacterium]